MAQEPSLPVPVIHSFSPESGVPGTLVVIQGTNFVGVTAVRFNGVDSEFMSITGARPPGDYPLGAKVPEGCEISWPADAASYVLQTTRDLLAPIAGSTVPPRPSSEVV